MFNLLQGLDLKGIVAYNRADTTVSLHKKSILSHNNLYVDRVPLATKTLTKPSVVEVSNKSILTVFVWMVHEGISFLKSFVFLS